VVWTSGHLQKIGVSRQWVIEVEKGKARAEVGLILRALDALSIPLSIAGTDAVSDTKMSPASSLTKSFRGRGGQIDDGRTDRSSQRS
jgi:hypothetical protein